MSEATTGFIEAYASSAFPDEWEYFVAPIPVEERSDAHYTLSFSQVENHYVMDKGR